MCILSPSTNYGDDQTDMDLQSPTISRKPFVRSSLPYKILLQEKEGIDLKEADKNDLKENICSLGTWQGEMREKKEFSKLVWQGGLD